MTREEALNSLKEILKENKLLFLSTYDTKNKIPCSCSVFYVYDSKFNLYYWSEKDAVHSKNISSKQKVSASIVNSNQEWGSNLKGAKIYGKASEVFGKELILAGTLYVKRFAKVKSLISQLKEFNTKKFNSKLYKIILEKAIILDEIKFGKEEYKEIQFEELKR